MVSSFRAFVMKILLLKLEWILAEHFNQKTKILDLIRVTREIRFDDLIEKLNAYFVWRSWKNGRQPIDGQVYCVNPLGGSSVRRPGKGAHVPGG